MSTTRSPHRVHGKHCGDSAALQDLTGEPRPEAAGELPVTQTIAIEAEVAVIDDLPADQFDVFVSHPTASRLTGVLEVHSDLFRIPAPSGSPGLPAFRASAFPELRGFPAALYGSYRP